MLKTPKLYSFNCKQHSSLLPNRESVYTPFITPSRFSLFHIAGTPFFQGADAISYFLLSIHNPPPIFLNTLRCPGNVFYLSVVFDLIVCLATSQLRSWKMEMSQLSLYYFRFTLYWNQLFFWNSIIHVFRHSIESVVHFNTSKNQYWLWSLLS